MLVGWNKQEYANALTILRHTVCTLDLKLRVKHLDSTRILVRSPRPWIRKQKLRWMASNKLHIQWKRGQLKRVGWYGFALRIAPLQIFCDKMQSMKHNKVANTLSTNTEFFRFTETQTYLELGLVSLSAYCTNHLHNILLHMRGHRWRQSSSSFGRYRTGTWRILTETCRVQKSWCLKCIFYCSRVTGLHVNNEKLRSYSSWNHTVIFKFFRFIDKNFSVTLAFWQTKFQCRCVNASNEWYSNSDLQH